MKLVIANWCSVFKMMQLNKGPKISSAGFAGMYVINILLSQKSNISEVEVWASSTQEHFLQIHGKFIRTCEDFYLINVYAPCDGRAKKELWESLSVRLQQLRGRRVCVCGDFNEIRCAEERRSIRGEGVVAATHFFNRFIDDNGMIDLPLCGRKYTWYKGYGSCMSRLDRFLLSEDW